MKDAWLRTASVALASLTPIAALASSWWTTGCNAISGADDLHLAARHEAEARAATLPSGVADAAPPPGGGKPDNRGGNGASHDPNAVRCWEPNDCDNDEVCCQLSPDLGMCIRAIACTGGVVCERDRHCAANQTCTPTTGGLGVCK
ncbi:MAG: hypothetical protein JWP87_5075 [Labilithrix sp.]|nr:hypothetical protein [Labilithrix sp.]